MLVEKTDRLYRNLKDWVTLDELDVEVHLVKEGVVLSRESRSSEKFMHGIKVLMAKNYIDNLSEETRKGMTEKAQQGLWPSYAPIGYRNVVGADGRKVIEPDPDMAPIILRLFEWYATGTMSLKELVRKARDERLSFRKSGDLVPRSTIHAILRKRLYMGEVDWDGHIYQGVHEPLVSRDLWEQVQAVLDGRHATRHRRVKRDFAFSRLINCGHCGCAVVGEIKKRKYVYYHCTGYKGKCPEAYVREEVLEQQFGALLDRLSFDAEVLDWVREALTQSHEDERRAHDEAIAPPGRLRPATEPGGRDVCRQAGRPDRHRVVRQNGCDLAGGTGRMPAVNRSAPGRQPLVHGRGRPASRTRPKRPPTLRKAGSPRKAPPLGLPGFELLLEGRPAHGRVPPTV